MKEMKEEGGKERRGRGGGEGTGERAMAMHY